jgi:hypothetical protein
MGKNKAELCFSSLFLFPTFFTIPRKKLEPLAEEKLRFCPRDGE